MVSSNKNGFNVTHKMVIGLSLPMTLAYLTTPILGLVDTAVVGRLGDAALIGGLAVGAIIIDFLFATFNFLRSGTTGLTAQALGADDKKEIQALLFRVLTVSTVIGLIMIASLPIIVSVGLYYMNAGTAVSKAAEEYLNIRILGSPVNLANFVLLGWLIGMGKSGTGLLLQIVLNGTNIILSILLGLTFGFGVAGVAWATVIAELVALMVGLYICWRLLGNQQRPSKARVFNRQAMWKFANLNVDIMIRSFALLFAFAFFTSVGAQFGELTLAANAVLMNFFMIAGYFLDGLATASEQIVGRAIGAKYKPAFNKGVTYTLLWNFILAAILALVFYMSGEQLVALITTLDSV